jgi:quinol-cytochrome oxidoreductase complex cytochrome b subunit
MDDPKSLENYLREAKKREEELRSRKKLRKVEGAPFFPHEVIRDSILICFFIAVTLFLSASFGAPLEKPGDPLATPKILLPDWYLLWSYGFLKFWTWDIPPYPAKVWGVVLQALLFIALIALPFLDRQKASRPTRSPFMASLGAAGIVFLFMLSVFSISDNIIVAAYPSITPAVLKPFVLLLPLAAMGATYLFVRWIRDEYEEKLNANYFKLR